MAYYVNSGQVSNGVILNYDSMYVSSGGTANRTTANSLGFVSVFRGGMANRTTVNSFGYQYVYSDMSTATALRTAPPSTGMVICMSAMAARRAASPSVPAVTCTSTAGLQPVMLLFLSAA